MPRRYRKPKPRQRIGDYRIFIGAFPTGPLVDKIQALREHYDSKTAAISPPHVTLAGTYWRSGPATAENEQELIDRMTGMAGKIGPFDLILGGIRTFGRRVVYLGVQPTDEIMTVRQHLIRLAGRDKHRRFTPHMTLAMRLGKAKTAAMVAELKAGEGPVTVEEGWEHGRFTIPIHELQLMQRAPDDPAWRPIFTMPL